MTMTPPPPTDAVLRLAVKRECFEAIKSGEKTEEYRLYNDYWRNRMSKGPFDKIVITLGYPKKGDTERTLVFPWVGFDVKWINHKHFGTEDVQVYALYLMRAKS